MQKKNHFCYTEKYKACVELIQNLLNTHFKKFKNLRLELDFNLHSSIREANKITCFLYILFYTFIQTCPIFLFFLVVIFIGFMIWKNIMYYEPCVYSEVPSRGSTQTTMSSSFTPWRLRGHSSDNTSLSASTTIQSLGTSPLQVKNSNYLHATTPCVKGAYSSQYKQIKATTASPYCSQNQQLLGVQSSPVTTTNQTAHYRMTPSTW